MIEATYERSLAAYHGRYRSLWDAIARTYVDNSWIIRVPFLGFSFDVNDLGLLGGTGLLVVLVCYRFFLTREVDNLRLSFEEARRIGKAELEEFYKLLAMRQVFTVPLTPNIRRTRFLVFTPKLICWFPVAVLSGSYDQRFRNRFDRRGTSQTEICFPNFVRGNCFGMSGRFGLHGMARLVRMDNLWDNCWKELQAPSQPSAQVAPSIEGGIIPDHPIRN